MLTPCPQNLARVPCRAVGSSPGGPGLRRTVWYELQARDWPFKAQAAEALIWQIGSGEGMKRLLASISLGKEVSVSSRSLSGAGPRDVGR